MNNDEYVSLSELAKALGITRIAVYKKVKKGQIKAIRVGRSFAVSKKYLLDIIGKPLEEADKAQIRDAVKKVVSEYGEVLKLLGKE
ncbi:MAG: excisionase family DNA-binding protein [Candidatus Omnitrophota bacterium]